MMTAVGCAARAARSGLRRVLLVNHGYPPLYNAGSEVYTQTLALGLQKRGTEVAVFTREENPFKPDYVVTEGRDNLDPRVRLFKVNHARESPYARFCNSKIDNAFDAVVRDFEPSVIHINHFNHLSLSLLQAPSASGVPAVLTLHGAAPQASCASP